MACYVLSIGQKFEKERETKNNNLTFQTMTSAIIEIYGPWLVKVRISVWLILIV